MATAPVYCRVVAFTSLCSRVSWRLLGELPLVTSFPMLEPYETCALNTSDQVTALVPEKLFVREATVGTYFPALNFAVDSAPRPRHRPLSTQNDASGSLPDCGGTM